MSEVKRIRVIVSGRVQGVGYRYFAEAEAKGRGLYGYVRNLPDGDVELVAQGAPEHLDSLLIELQRGPQLARVDRIRVIDLPADQELEQRFRIRT